MRKPIYSEDCRDNLLNIRAYLTRESGDKAIGRRFVAVLRQQCDKLAGLPLEIGRPRPDLHDDVRSFAFRGYVIFFRYIDDRFEVLNILHGHRDIVAYFADDPT